MKTIRFRTELVECPCINVPYFTEELSCKTFSVLEVRSTRGPLSLLHSSQSMPMISPIFTVNFGKFAHGSLNSAV